MSYIDIILLAFALSVDVIVVSFSYGLCIEKRRRYSALILAFTTALFHSLMPLIGYFFTDLIREFIQPYSKYIVFLIFMYLGLVFIKDALRENSTQKLCIDIKSLLLIGIATSIDVFSAGISLALTSSPMKFSIATFGSITFINSLIGYLLGSQLKVFKSNYLEILGGLILIILAIKAIL